MSEHDSELSSVVAALVSQMKRSRGRPKVHPLQTTDAVRAMLVLQAMNDFPALKTRRQAIDFMQFLASNAEELADDASGKDYQQFAARFPKRDLEESVSRGVRTLRNYLLKNSG